MPENHGRTSAVQTQLEQASPDARPCNRPDCKCCSYRKAVLDTLLDAVAKTAGMPENIPAVTGPNACLARECLKAREEAEREKEKYAGLNRRLNSTVNGIRTVAVSDRKSSGRRGRPKGQKATINMRPEDIDRDETIDCKECPRCGSGDCLSGVTDEYDRVVRVLRFVTENVRYVIKRRYCRRCKRQVSGKVPDAMPYARTSSNHTALMTHLNIKRILPRQGRGDQLRCPEGKDVALQRIPQQDQRKQEAGPGAPVNQEGHTGRG